MKISHIRAFDTPYWITILEDFHKHFNQDLITYAHDLKNKGENRKLSNEGGWQSTLLPLEDFNIFFKEIYKVIQKLNLGVENMKVDQLWMNINYKGDWNQMHLHSGQYDLCGNYYIKTPSNCGKLVFKDPRAAAMSSMFLLSRYTKYEFHKIEPKEGMLILFPPYLEHMVEPSKTDEERISLAFDLRLE